MVARLAVVLSLIALSACAGGNRNDADLGPSGRDLATASTDLAGGGTPPDGGAAASTVRINEVDPNGPSETTDPDWIELVNLGAATVDLSSWKLRDDNAASLTAFPAGTTIPPGGYLVVWANDNMAMMAGGVSMPFKLSGSKGDEVHLVAPDGSEADMTSFGANAVATGKSWGRSPSGTGAFKVLDTPTRGMVNP